MTDPLTKKTEIENKKTSNKKIKQWQKLIEKN